MALLHQMSQPGISSEVDLFSMPVTDTTVSHSSYATFKPINSVIDANSKIEFRLTGCNDSYFDWSDSFLHLTLKVINHDGDLVSKQNISLSNNVLHSLFSDVELLSNSTIISSSNHCYPYKAYIEKLMSYSDAYFDSQGLCAAFVPDTDNFTLTDNNEGFAARKALISDSTSFEVIDRLHIPLCSQQRFTLNDMDFTLSLTRSSDAFVICGDKYQRNSNDIDLAAKVQILDATFFIRKQTLYPSLILAHQKLLESGKNALYPVSEGNIKFFTIPSGNQTFTAENVFSSRVPTRIALAFVMNSAFNGSYSSSPFKFENFDLSYLDVSVNNVSTPVPPLNLDFTHKSRNILPHWMMYSSLNLIGQNSGFVVDRRNFADGYNIFSFDLQKCSASDDSVPLERSGNVRIEAKFRTALKNAVNLIVYHELPRTFEIDQFRQMK